MLGQRPHRRQKDLRALAGAGGKGIRCFPQPLERHSTTLGANRGNRRTRLSTSPRRLRDFAQSRPGQRRLNRRINR